MIIEHLPMIRAAGYTAILLSPHQRRAAATRASGYDPFDFRSFKSAHGTETQLAELIRKAHALQIQVYADMVLNHMCTNNFKYPRFSKQRLPHLRDDPGLERPVAGRERRAHRSR